MIINDFKSQSLDKEFEKLKNVLKNCSSFVQQKEALIDFYSDKNFNRDELNERKLDLKITVEPYKKELINLYTSVFVAVETGLLVSFLFNWVMNPESISWAISQKFVVIVLLILVLPIPVLIYVCKKYRHKEIPMQEIRELELSTLEAILKSGETEVDFAKVMANIENLTKTEMK